MKQRALHLVAACVAASLIGAAASAQAAKPSPSSARVPQIKFTQYQLANGLRVILSVDRTAPVVAVNVTYDVGSRNEKPGRTGFAHLFEHMMFQGSTNVGRGEHMQLIQDNGGTMNGSTSEDRTNYYEELPANQLDLALFLESDRMRGLDVNQANLDNQRSVVQEEKRQGSNNRPGGGGEAARDTYNKLVYTSFGYQHSTIGSMEDLNAATLDDVKAFFKMYYAPNNAVLVVVGDFNEGAARRKIEKYFGSIPRGPQPPPVELSERPFSGEVRKEITDAGARMTRYQVAYRTVTADHADAPALQILGNILGGGRDGRLRKAIVDKKIGTMAMADGSTGRGPGLFSLSASVGRDGDWQAVEKALEAEIARIQNEGVTDAELAKVRRRARVAALMGGGGLGRGGGGGGGMGTVLSRANSMAQDAIYYNDPGRMNTRLSRTEAVTSADIQRVAKKYLVKENRIVLVTMPEQQPEDDFGFFERTVTEKGAN